RRRQDEEHILDYAVAGAERLAEVAGQHRADEGEILHVDRLIEAELLPERGERGGTRLVTENHGGGIARHQAHQDEDGGEHDEQRRNGEQEAPADEDDHAAARVLVRRSGVNAATARVVMPFVTMSAAMAPTTGTSWKPWPEKPKAWNSPGARADA